MWELQFPWNLYEEKQKHLKRCNRLTDQTWGIENGLNELLSSLESGCNSTNQKGVEFSLNRSIASRARAERNRASLLRKYLKPAPEFDPEPQRHPAAFSPAHIESQLNASVQLLQVRGMMTPKEWDLISRIDAGFDFKEMAQMSGNTPGSIRTKISRLRARLKESGLGRSADVDREATLEILPICSLPG